MQETEFPFYNAYKSWVVAKHRRCVIFQSEKQRVDSDDSDFLCDLEE